MFSLPIPLLSGHLGYFLLSPVVNNAVIVVIFLKKLVP